MPSFPTELDSIKAAQGRNSLCVHISPRVHYIKVACPETLKYYIGRGYDHGMAERDRTSMTLELVLVSNRMYSCMS